jgi:hypothetical protein
MSTVTSTIKETTQMTATETPVANEVAQVNVNEQLVQLDNLLTAISYLHEEVRSRQIEMLGASEVERMVKEFLSDRGFYTRILNYHKRYQIPTIKREVMDEIKNDIDSHLENYILSKIDERVELALSNRASN